MITPPPPKLSESPHFKNIRTFGSYLLERGGVTMGKLDLCCESLPSGYLSILSVVEITWEKSPFFLRVVSRGGV